MVVCGAGPELCFGGLVKPHPLRALGGWQHSSAAQHAQLHSMTKEFATGHDTTFWAGDGAVDLQRDDDGLVAEGRVCSASL